MDAESETCVDVGYWTKLDDDWFLLPNVWKVYFTTGIVMGGSGGRHIAIDEYGRNPRNPKYQDQRRRALEHQTFEAGKRDWAKKTMHPGPPTSE